MFNNILLIMSLIILLISIYLIINQNKKISIKIKSILVKSNSVLNFEKDMECLLYLISGKCENSKHLILNPKQITQTKILNDDDLNLNVEYITLDVLNTISDEYKQSLYKYFSEQGLLDFVTETIMIDLTKTIVNMNSDKMKKLNIRKKINIK